MYRLDVTVFSGAIISGPSSNLIIYRNKSIRVALLIMHGTLKANVLRNVLYINYCFQIEFQDKFSKSVLAVLTDVE